MHVVSVRENPEFKDLAIQYFQSKWANLKHQYRIGNTARLILITSGVQ